MENKTNDVHDERVEKKNTTRKRNYQRTHRTDTKKEMEKPKRERKKIVGSNFIDLGLEGEPERQVRKTYPKRNTKNKMYLEFKKSNLKIIALG